MAIVTKGNNGKEPMADDDRDRAEDDKEESRKRERDEDREDAARNVAPSGPTIGGGFFHLYKPGQGYWTRMGTAGGAVLLIALLARFIYISLATRTNLDVTIVNGVEKHGYTMKVIITAIFVAIAAGLTWYYLNKPFVVDFSTATESEMKKVNWTSRREIIGSTKVVIIFMFLIAFFLFFVDLFFAYLFYLIKVLHKAPFT